MPHMTTVLVAGSSGFIGTALCREMRARGWAVRRLVRRAPTDKDESRWDPSTPLSPAHLSGVDVVVNLAGAGLGDHRWTPEYKDVIRSSRVTTTATLARAVAGADHPVRYVQGSAVGLYGNRADAELDELSPPGEGFLAGVVTEWEAATTVAVDAGASVTCARTGLVFAPHGGAAAPLLRLGRLGLLGPIASGKQWWPWISLTDEIDALIHLATRVDIQGPVNLVGPAPSQQIDVARAIAARLHRPAFVPVPAFALKAVLGEFSADVLASERIVGSALVDSGFQHTHKTLDDLAAYLTADAS